MGSVVCFILGCRLVVGELVLFILFDGVYWLVLMCMLVFLVPVIMC